MKDKNLFLNIQLFAENGEGEFGMRSAECGIEEEGKSDAFNDKNEESIVNEAVTSDALTDGASEFGMRNADCGMNEVGGSDGLNNEAGINDEEVVNEDTEEDELIHEREARLRNRISDWLNQSRGIKELYPDFDLRNELRSSELFSRLVISGAPLQAAYEIVHKDEILSGAMAYTADKVREQVVKNIESKGRRPLENGISSESAVMTAIDVNALTAKDIHRILKQVENGASIKF